MSDFKITESTIEKNVSTVDCPAIVQGTCGWSDQSLVECGRFYPRKGNISSEEKLSYFSRVGMFGCIEVDSTTYNVPLPEVVSKWVQSTTPGFKFHFKAFGFLVNGGGKVGSLPVDIRKEYSLDKMDKNLYLSLSKLSTECGDAIWRRFHQALLPAVNAKKIGVVIFQFQLNFLPSESSRLHVEYCAKMLDPSFPMAVEFRNRKWLEGDHLHHTVDWLSQLRGLRGIALVACDDLEHEVYQKDSDQKGLSEGQPLVHLPVVINTISCKDFVYVRVHRRHGPQRILADWEIEQWISRIFSLTTPSTSNNKFTGPIYFLWGTDFEDQPMVNALKLTEALPRHLLPLSVLRSKFSKSIDNKLAAFGNNGTIAQAFARQKKTYLNAQHNYTIKNEELLENKDEGPILKIRRTSLHSPENKKGESKSSILRFFKPSV